MELHNLELLLKLMAIQKTSARRVSAAAGWKSHTYLQRLLRGEVNTLKRDPATRIAHFLGVPEDVLFVTRLSTNSGDYDQESRRRKVS